MAFSLPAAADLAAAFFFQSASRARLSLTEEEDEADEASAELEASRRAKRPDMFGCDEDDLMFGVEGRFAEVVCVGLESLGLQAATAQAGVVQKCKVFWTPNL